MTKDLHQRKFYTNTTTDTMIEMYRAQHPKMGYSEAVRDIISSFMQEQYVTVPMIGRIKNGKVEVKAAQ